MQSLQRIVPSLDEAENDDARQPFQLDEATLEAIIDRVAASKDVGK